MSAGVGVRAGGRIFQTMSSVSVMWMEALTSMGVPGEQDPAERAVGQ